MKRRDPAAARLEEYYIALVKSALVGREPSEIEETIQSIRTHIEEELSQTRDEEVSAARMAKLLEQLGPPEAYSENGGARAKVAERKEAAVRATSDLAIASLVLSLLSLTLPFLGFYPGALFFIAAIVCGHIARRRCRRDPRLGGSGLALAGLIVGYSLLVALAFLYWFMILKPHGPPRSSDRDLREMKEAGRTLITTEVNGVTLTILNPEHPVESRASNDIDTITTDTDEVRLDHMHLFLNRVDYGQLNKGDKVVVKKNLVTVNGQKRLPAPAGK
jgi:hypothetical protein